MERNYDLIVLGGGSGGYAAAKKASGLGLKVAIVEGAKEMGGLCILRGCMPTKALLETSNRMRAIHEADEFAISVGKPTVDIDALRDRKTRLIDDFQHWRVKGLESGNFDLIRGHGKFLGPHEIEVAGHGTFSARTFIVATGSVEKIPPIPGLAESPYWTSDDIVNLPRLPESVVVVGTGAVGMESAFLFQGLGSNVTIISRSRPLITDVDIAISEAMEKRCQDLGIEIVFEDPLAEVAYHDDFELKLESGNSLSCDQLIMASGRKPNLANLDLAKAGFSDNLQRLEINEFCQTSQPHIFGVGDVSSPLAVVHLAVMQGEAAGANAASLLREEIPDETWEERLNIFGIFTDPELVEVGWNEKEARERGYNPVSAQYRYDDQGKGEIVGEKHGLVILTADRDSGKLLGASGLGPHVIDYAHTILVALHQNLTVAEFLKIPSYHPTLGEIWTYVAEELLEELPPS
jgi:pyruvate/2-oxoglutarate dehydrogenase complex dihydrolipoamide dehydrogenase (E3) component